MYVSDWEVVDFPHQPIVNQVEETKATEAEAPRTNGSTQLRGDFNKPW